MKKIGLFLVLLLMPLALVRGEPVGQNKVKEAVHAFIAGCFPSAAYTISEVLPVSTAGEVSLYAVNLSPEGWILLSADDKVLPVIGFSFTGKYDLNFTRLSSVASWISEYGLSVHHLKANKTVIRNQLWDDPAGEFRLKSATSETVDPFIPVTWDQDGGWNRYCPEDAEGPDGHAYVGCVAVAMSQAMSVYKYPARATGTSSYNHDVYGSITVQYDNAPEYKWDSMAFSTSDKYNALLLYHAAVAVKMDFGPDASGAMISKLSGALATYFKYYKGVKRVARMEDDEAWRVLLVDELLQGHPIVYAGNADDGEPGHAFNIDGVMNDKYFHLNWGWSGKYNGYYVIDNLDPSTFDFFANHEAVFDIRPPVYCPTDLDLTKKTVKERMPAGTYVGKLKITDEAADNIYEVTVKGDSIDVDQYADADFYLSNDSLMTGREFNYNERNEYTIFVAVTDQFSHFYQEKFVIGIIKNSVTSEVSNSMNAPVEIYPNPSAGQFVIKVTENGIYEMEIIDAWGRIVYHAVVENTGQPVELNFGSPGFYLLRMISPSGQLILRKILIN